MPRANVGDRVSIVGGDLNGEEVTVVHVWGTGNIDAEFDDGSVIALMPWEWTPLSGELVKVLKQYVDEKDGAE